MRQASSLFIFKTRLQTPFYSVWSYKILFSFYIQVLIVFYVFIVFIHIFMQLFLILSYNKILGDDENPEINFSHAGRRK